MTIQKQIDALNIEIKRLEQQVSNLKSQQSRCEHKWSEIKYNPEEVREMYVIGYRTQGIHMDPEYGSTIKSKDRWSRYCTCCGITQYTYNNPKPVEPKLDWK